MFVKISSKTESRETMSRETQLYLPLTISKRNDNELFQSVAWSERGKRGKENA